ncbi:MAG: DUF1592 domain-containing protein, partial [Myxococcota bacterium]
EELLGEDARLAANLLPRDFRTPFDNEAALQESSRAFAEAAERLAETVSERFVSDGARRSQVVGCATEDAACLETFINQFGARALRRPMTAEEVTGLVALADLDNRDFWSGVQAVLRVLLLDPEFLYRVEQASEREGAPGTLVVSGSEVATRMAFVVWGTIPDQALMDAAAAGQLATPAGRRAQAQRMLQDPRAITQADRFHALWLGYDELPTSQFFDEALVRSMRQESLELIRRVLFTENRPWTDIFTLDEAYVDRRLMIQAGFAFGDGEAPDDISRAVYKDLHPIQGANGNTDGDLPGWVSLRPNPRRLGIMTQGSFSAVAAGLDTSPVRRGLLVRERLMCELVPLPSADIVIDAPPSGDPDNPNHQCKEGLYEQHRSDPSCQGCHQFIDPVGFGLERFDKYGGYRTRDYTDPESLEMVPEGSCELSGEGRVQFFDGRPAFEFSGVADLARQLVQQQVVDACMARYFVTYAMGRQVQLQLGPNIPEMPYITEVLTQWRTAGGRYSDLVYALIESPEFVSRWEVAP